MKSFATLPAEKNFESHLAPSLDAYKKFKKMFVVDESLGDFKGDNYINKPSPKSQSSP